MRRVGDFHSRLRFTRSTIPEGKWRLLIVYSVKGDHHHHLSSWDPGAHVVQTNICHSGLLPHGGRGWIGLIFGRYMRLASRDPFPIIAYSVVKRTPSQSLLSKSIFCNPNLLTFCHFLTHEFYFLISNYPNFLTPYPVGTSPLAYYWEVPPTTPWGLLLANLVEASTFSNTQMPVSGKE